LAPTLKKADGRAPVHTLSLLEGLETDLTQGEDSAQALLERQICGSFPVPLTELVCD
jgi:hypothetical protein